MKERIIEVSRQAYYALDHPQRKVLRSLGIAPAEMKGKKAPRPTSEKVLRYLVYCSTCGSSWYEFLYVYEQDNWSESRRMDWNQEPKAPLEDLQKELRTCKRCQQVLGSWNKDRLVARFIKERSKISG